MSLDKFFEDTDPHVPAVWGSDVEKERKNRIKLSIAAYSYEVHSDSIMSDSEFDDLANKINVQTNTDNEIMDDFFKEEFNPYTGQWIHKHPNKDGLEKLYQKFYMKKRKTNK